MTFLLDKNPGLFQLLAILIKAISQLFSVNSKGFDVLVRKVKVKVAQLYLTLCDPMDASPWNSLGQNTGVDSHSLLQRIFPSQGSNPSLPHCRRILYQLSHKVSPRTLEWAACPFSSGYSWPSNWTRVSWIPGGFFTIWAMRQWKDAQYH